MLVWGCPLSPDAMPSKQIHAPDKSACRNLMAPSRAAKQPLEWPISANGSEQLSRHQYAVATRSTSGRHYIRMWVAARLDNNRGVTRRLSAERRQRLPRVNCRL